VSGFWGLSNKMERIKTGIPGLDEMLKGGIPIGRTILVSGHCGSGKTVFASQFIGHGYHRNEAGVYVTLEQGRDKLFQDSKTLGIDFKRMESTNKVKVIGGAIGNISRFKFRTNAKIDDLIQEIKEVIIEIKAKRVVIDSINLFAMLFDDDSQRRNAVAALVSMLEDLKCTTILTCEVPEHSKQISWFGFEDFVVDGVIFLHRMQNSGRYERAISIVKMRGVDHISNIRAIEILKNGITVYDQEPDFVRMNSLN